MVYGRGGGVDPDLFQQMKGRTEAERWTQSEVFREARWKSVGWHQEALG